MKTATKAAAIGGASVLAVVAILLGVPAAMAATQAGSSTTSSVIPGATHLSPGDTVTFTSTSGYWRQSPGSSSSTAGSNSASGTVTLTVSGSFRGGYALSITSGSLTLNGVTYTLGSGSAEMGPLQAHMVGQGVFTSTAPGSFLFAAGAHANFQGQSYNTLRFDIQAGGVEYGVVLLVTVQVS